MTLKSSNSVSATDVNVVNENTPLISNKENKNPPVVKRKINPENPAARFGENVKQVPIVVRHEVNRLLKQSSNENTNGSLNNNATSFEEIASHDNSVPNPAKDSKLSTYIELLEDVIQHEKTSREAAEAASAFKAWFQEMEAESDTNHQTIPVDDQEISAEQSKSSGINALVNILVKLLNIALPYGTQVASIFYGSIYGIVSHFKAYPILGNIAVPFAVCSAGANYAQNNITLNGFVKDFKANYNFRLKFAGGGIETLSCGIVAKSAIEKSLLVKFLLGIMDLVCLFAAVCTAAPIASATLEATGFTAASLTMWGFRTMLAFKSTIGLLAMIQAKLTSLTERLTQVRNGDKNLLRALLETSVLFGSAYIAVMYSLSQWGTIGEYCIKELSPVFSKAGFDLTGKEAWFSAFGIGPLMALNMVFIVGGGETALDLVDRFHPLLLLTMLLAAPTGFPGIALIDTSAVMEKVNAYMSAFLSNWRSLEQLPYFVAKVQKDRALYSMEQLQLLLSNKQIKSTENKEAYQQLINILSKYVESRKTSLLGVEKIAQKAETWNKAVVGKLRSLWGAASHAVGYVTSSVSSKSYSVATPFKESSDSYEAIQLMPDKANGWRHATIM